MAIIQRAKSSIYGLNADLLALQAADSAELARAEAAELVLTNDLATEVTNRTNADTALQNSITAEASTRASAVTTLQNNITAEASTRSSADTAINTRIDNLEQTVATGSSIRGSFAAVSGLATLDESTLMDGYMYGIRATNDIYVYASGLTEYDYQPAGWTGGFIQFLNVADVTNAVATEAAARDAADVVLQGNIDSADARAVAAELVLTNALAQEVSDREAAIAQEVIDRNEAIRLGGAVHKIESRTVTSGKITLSFAPKNGLAGILNFATVRYTDGNGVSYDATLSAGSSASEFLVNTDTAGQWDGNSVAVQYVYVQPV